MTHVADIFSNLCNFFNLTQKDAISFIASAPYQYKHFTIPKKNNGHRQISQPSRALKIIQRWMLSSYFANCIIHESAMAYVHGKNIRENALAHCMNSYLLKIDLKNFFPSITFLDLDTYLTKHETHYTFTDDDLFIIKRIFFMISKNSSFSLSIGAPSSPSISNFIMYDIDVSISDYCKLNNIAYTRYADDLTFSTNTKDILDKAYAAINHIFSKTTSPNLEINTAKTVYSSKKHRRQITGIIISNDDHISLGNSRKKFIRTGIHKFITDTLSPEERRRLKGMLAFAKYCDFPFFERMESKYGTETIKSVLSCHD